MKLVVSGCAAVAVAIVGIFATTGRSKAREEPYLSVLPIGLSSFMPIPQGNPLTREKVALGRRLFMDVGLSGDGSVSCASCHLPELAFSDGRGLAVGIEGRIGRRSSPSLVNSAYRKTLFWDGRAGTLEEQALMPMENPDEMGSTLQAVIEYVQNDLSYRIQLRRAFGSDAVTPDRLARAIASFERTIVSGNTPFDRYSMLDDETALSDSALRGLALFSGKARCVFCHEGRLFTDERFHNTGVSFGVTPVDLGAYEVTGRDEDRGRFKTPTLRELVRTAPFMHDGSIATLEEVVEHYDRGGNPNPWIDGAVRKLGLGDREKADLVEFLESLSQEPEG